MLRHLEDRTVPFHERDGLSLHWFDSNGNSIRIDTGKLQMNVGNGFPGDRDAHVLGSALIVPARTPTTCTRSPRSTPPPALSCGRTPATATAVPHSSMRAATADCTRFPPELPPASRTLYGSTRPPATRPPLSPLRKSALSTTPPALWPTDGRRCARGPASPAHSIAALPGSWARSRISARWSTRVVSRLRRTPVWSCRWQPGFRTTM